MNKEISNSRGGISAATGNIDLLSSIRNGRLSTSSCANLHYKAPIHQFAHKELENTYGFKRSTFVTPNLKSSSTAHNETSQFSSHLPSLPRPRNTVLPSTLDNPCPTSISIHEPRQFPPMASTVHRDVIQSKF